MKQMTKELIAPIIFFLFVAALLTTTLGGIRGSGSASNASTVKSLQPKTPFNK